MTLAASGPVVTFGAGRKVLVDGAPTNAGSPAEGLLMGARLIQAAVEEYNPNRRALWRYPDTGSWSATRNLAEFVNALDGYAAAGVNAFTVGMQGGHPRFRCASESGVAGRNFSMFTSDGTLRSDAKDRLALLIAEAGDRGLVVIVQLFYQNQDQRLADNAAVIRATAQAATFLRDLDAGNVLVEIANEVSDRNYKHSALDPPAIDDRIRQVKDLWPGALVTANMQSDGKLGPDAVRRAVDWVSIHANALTAAGMADVIRKAKADSRLAGKPIAVTEDPWDAGTTPLNTAVELGAGWHLYRQGCERTGTYKPGTPARYRDGFQSLPVNWSIRSGDPAKVEWAERLAELTGRA